MLPRFNHLAARNRGQLLVVLLTSILPPAALHGRRAACSAAMAAMAGVELARCRYPFNHYLVRVQ